MTAVLRRCVQLALTLALFGCFASCGGDDPAKTAPSSTTPAGADVTTVSPAASTPPGGEAAAFAYIAADGSLWLAATSAAPRKLADGPVDPSYGSASARWSPDGRSIAFRDASGSLVVLDVASAATRMIEQAIVGTATWSPDGRHILYATGEHGEGGMIATPDGANKRSLGPYRYLQFSPDGTHLLLVDETPPDDLDRTRQLYVSDGDGANTRPLARFAGLAFGASAWSADSRYVAYWNEDHGGSALIGDMAVVDVDTGRAYDIGSFSSDEAPQWSSTPGRIVFHNIEIDPVSGALTELFPRPAAIIGWSPDMQRVAIVEGAAFGAGTRRLIILTPADGARVTLNENSNNLAHAGVPGYRGLWSPDGRYFAFQVVASDQAPSWSVYDTATATLNRIDVPEVDSASFSLTAASC